MPPPILFLSDIHLTLGTAPGGVSSPASINKTWRRGSADKRLANTEPAEPPPTIT